jgi:hypothetical protein
MANNVEQAVVARAEPSECSRWAVIFLLACAGVTIVCFSLYLFGNLDCLPPLVDILGLLLVLLLLAVGFSLFFLSLMLIIEQYSGGDLYGVMTVDWLLTL